MSAVEVEAASARAANVAEAVNRARDLQDPPGNDLTPTELAEQALALGGEIDAWQVEVEGRAGIEGSAWAPSPPWPRAPAGARADRAAL